MIKRLCNKSGCFELEFLYNNKKYCNSTLTLDNSCGSVSVTLVGPIW